MADPDSENGRIGIQFGKYGFSFGGRNPIVALLFLIMLSSFANVGATLWAYNESAKSRDYNSCLNRLTLYQLNGGKMATRKIPNELYSCMPSFVWKNVHDEEP